MKTAAELYWLWPVCVDGYVLRTLSSGRRAVIPRTTEMKYKDVFGFPDLWNAFRRVRSEEQILEFTTNFGVLESEGIRLKRYSSLDHQHRLMHSVTIERWREIHAELMKFQAQTRVARGTKQPAFEGRLKGYWVFTPTTGRLTVNVSHTSLAAGIALQMLFEEAGIASPARACEECGKMFVRESGGRRRDARFCGQPCRHQSYNRRRKL
jgi:hypothetical protein